MLSQEKWYLNFKEILLKKKGKDPLSFRLDKISGKKKGLRLPKHGGCRQGKKGGGGAVR